MAAAFYHAQVEPEAKRMLHEQWLRDEVQVMVATSAFGMGVHKDDVRLVVHWTLPDSVMALSQEWGRAGRDGERAGALPCMIASAPQICGLWMRAPGGCTSTAISGMTVSPKGRFKEKLGRRCSQRRLSPCPHVPLVMSLADDDEP